MKNKRLLEIFTLLAGMAAFWLLAKPLPEPQKWILFQTVDLAANLSALAYLGTRYKREKSETNLLFLIFLIFTLAQFLYGGFYGDRRIERISCFLMIMLMLVWEGIRSFDSGGPVRGLVSKLTNPGCIKAIYWVFLLMSGILAWRYLSFIFIKACWVIGDDCILMPTILSGKPYPLLDALTEGRFRPLYLAEFIPFILVGDHPVAFYAWSALKAVLTGFFLYFTFFEAVLKGSGSSEKSFIIKPSWPAFLSIVFVGLFFMTPYVRYMFVDIIFPEQTVIPLFAAFVFFYQKFLKSENVFDGAIAWACASYACYLKETVFIVLVVFSITGWIQRKSFTPRQRMFHQWLFLGALVFLLLYALIVMPHVLVSYAQSHRSSRIIWPVALKVSAENLLLPIGLLVLFLKTPSIILRRQIDFYDRLLLTGLSFAGVFIILRFPLDYYYLPTYIFILPPILNFIVLKFTQKKALGKSMALLVVALLGIYYQDSGKDLVTISHQTVVARRDHMTLVKYLVGKNVYEVESVEKKPVNIDRNWVDKWAVISLETFVDFYSKGKYTSLKKINLLNGIDEIKPLKKNDVLLVPIRLRDLIKVPNSFAKVEAYFYYDVYTSK